MGESVSTNSPARMRSETKRLAEATKKRFESVFPENFTAENYAETLIRKCAAIPPEGRSREVDSTIGKLLSLERLCFSFCMADRADFFRQAKRSYVSRLLESVLPKLRNADYRSQTLETWSQWIYAKGFADIGDFWFWNGWRDRFFAEEHAPYEDIPLNF
ncbi:MAG: hypothetical protein WA194_08000 [Patescibacteria group bacterium]